MMEQLALSIGVGLVVGILCTEAFGIAAAGLVVPGYLALYLTKPRHLAVTLAIAFVAYGVVRLVGSVLILHGRRRTALMILVGYLLGMLTARFAGLYGDEYAAIGFVIPGLIAVWMDKQSIAQTLTSLCVVTVLVRLVLVVALGAELSLP
jgi:poly-gamma-glutamate biosynthesis protein PgsC/CapC